MKERGYYIYAVEMPGMISGVRVVKIGITNNPKKRLAALQTGAPNKLVLVAAIRVRNRQRAEHLERLFSQKHEISGMHGEWYGFVGSDYDVHGCLKEHCEAA